MSEDVKVKKVEGITKESTQEMIDEALEAYPGEGEEEAGAAPGAQRPGGLLRLRQVQPEDGPRRDERPRLRLRRRQGGGLGPDPRHGPRLPRPGRLRLVLVGHPPQPDVRHERRHPVRHAVHLRLPGEGHRLRRRQEAGPAPHRGPRALPAGQGDLGPLRVPGRAHRRRHQLGGQEDRPQELDLPIIPCNCEGFRGVSQSLGHHISNDTIRDYIIGTREFAEPAGPYDIALIGDYNIGGDVWSRQAAAGRDAASTSRPSGPATASWRRSPPPTR